ncbi:MAG TPA: citrate synthase [Kofleriaceae bacterium]|jgi:citrate synthase|nr:citrate synthase [Kofleriaceae bacterium]
MTSSVTNPGLEGVVVADTEISEVDGERGRLVIAGADVEQLVASTGFEGAVRAVLAAGGADPAGLGDAADAGLGAARTAAWEHVARLGDALDHPDAMDALRTALAHLRPAPGRGADIADAIAAIGAAPVFVAAWHRLRAGQPPIAPDPRLGHAADYLRMTLGRPADAPSVRALDAYLVTVVDHAMSASTFTARVIASTASDLISAMVGAVGALKGPLHGGAPGPVLDMLDAIGAPERAEAWLSGELAAGRRIMGMGHRVYRVRDPRAAVLEEAVRPLASPRLELARAVERAAGKILRERKPDRSLAANVEFYTAVLLDAVGLPREQFSATFAVSRIAGWSAHVLEQRRTGRLIRPASHYTGKMP